MTEKKKKYIDKKDYLEFDNINLRIDILEWEKKYKDLMSRINDLTAQYHRCESERRSLLALATENERKSIEIEMNNVDSKISAKEEELELFIDTLQREKNIKIRDHLINPKTLELKPVPLPNKK